MNFQSSVTRTASGPVGGYCNLTASAIPQDAGCEPSPGPVGLFDGLQSFRHRLVQVNNVLDGILQRAYGPRPVSAENAKNPEQPSVKLVGASIEQEIYTLEKMAQELANFIG